MAPLAPGGHALLVEGGCRGQQLRGERPSVQVLAEGVAHGGAVPGPLAEGGERGGRPVGDHVRAAPAADERHLGGGPDHRDGAGGGAGQGQGAGFVAEQHRPGGGHLAGDAGPGGGVARGPGGGPGRQQPEAVHGGQDPVDGEVDGGLGHGSAAHRLAQRPAEVGAAGHLHVEAGADGGDGAVGGVPVGHHPAVEPPAPAQQFVEQRLVLAGVDAVDLVVRAHDGARAGHGGLEAP